MHCTPPQKRNCTTKPREAPTSSDRAINYNWMPVLYDYARIVTQARYDPKGKNPPLEIAGAILKHARNHGIPKEVWVSKRDWSAPFEVSVLFNIQKYTFNVKLKGGVPTGYVWVM